MTPRDQARESDAYGDQALEWFEGECLDGIGLDDRRHIASLTILLQRVASEERERAKEEAERLRTLLDMAAHVIQFELRSPAQSTWVLLDDITDALRTSKGKP